MVGRRNAGAAAGGLLVTLFALVLGLAWAQTSGAASEPGLGCGHRHLGEANRNPNPGGQPPLLIGDSTTLLPIPGLTKVGFDVNARGCRGFRDSVVVARNLRKRHELPHLVLINTYANGGVTPDLIEFALKVLGARRVLGLITTYNADTGAAPAPTTDVLVAAAEQFPTRIVLLDWVKYSLPHHRVDDWFRPDLYHPNLVGARAYARFLKRALPVSREGSFPPLS
jgi:hypothetical protein